MKDLRKTTLLAAFFLAACAGLAHAQDADEPATAWRVDFDSPEEIAGVHYAVRAGKDTNDGVVFDLADGVLTFGVDFAPESGTWDHGVLAWGDGMPWGFWQWKVSPFKRVDVSKFPVVEFRARRTPGREPSLCLTPSFDSDAGATFTQMNFRLTDDWQVFTFRFSPLSSVPGHTTPKLLKGMIFRLGNGHRPNGLEIDWIRVRAFTPREKAQDDVIASNMRSYRAPVWKQPFFLYGPYGPSIYTSARQGGFEGAYGNMVRAHMNFLMCPHDISYYRYQGSEGKSQDDNVSDFLSVNREAVAAAREVGLSLCLDVRGFQKDLVAHGPDYIQPAIRRVADAFRDDPNVLGYTCADEPQTNNLWEVVGVKKLFEEADPAKLVAWPLADALWVDDFEPYSTVHCGDMYPVTTDGRQLQRVAAQMDEYDRKTRKPVWFIIQAIGQNEWWSPAARGSYLTPTEPEFLRMAFMALGRGAKGLLFFDWYHTPWQTLVDRFGNPGPLYAPASSLGNRLAAVGPILSRAHYDERRTTTYFPLKDTQPFEICAFNLAGASMLFVICNADLNSSHDLDMKLPQLTKNVRTVLDIEALTIDSGFRLHAPDVPPGDGRFFVLGWKEQLEKLKLEVLSNRKAEAERAARPDKVIAERWGDDDAEMRALGARLDACARKLGELFRAITVGDDKPAPGKEAAWDAFRLHERQYDSLRSAWIAGRRDGLSEAVATLTQAVDSALAQTPAP
ncbi:MAG: hypothetical protein V2A58_18660 [Planctomycetota bacterium]